jgi:nucleotide-binding universal stress UspA family protein
MFERIVAAIDSDHQRSAKVVEATAEVARGRNASVLVAHVREVERPAQMLAKAGAIPPAMSLDGDGDGRALVESALQRLHEMGVEAEGRTGRDGSASAAELLDLAERHGANLIVVGDRGSTVSDLLQGGVAHRIVHLAGCPVLVVR